MPAYRLYPLDPKGDPEPPVQMTAFSDAAAMRWAMRRDFPFGCDIWSEDRFVGRVHRAQAPDDGPERGGAP